jgi:taurine dioxygenase
MTIRIRAADGAGAYVEDVQLDALNQSTTDTLRDALGEYGVLFFREQSLTPDQHIALAERFGEININRFFTPVDGYPKIAQVLKEPDQQKNIGEQWHTDHSYDQIPALGSILVARELPKTGGDTIFASMFAAYDALDDAMNQKLAGLTATHSSRHAFGPQAYEEDDDLAGRLGNTAAATQDAIHPLIISHPISGKKALYVNPGFTLHINELEAAESDALLQQIYTHCQNPDFSHRFSWQDGSIAFWDNRATWHSAMNDYAGQRRLMHRITVAGAALTA